MLVRRILQFTALGLLWLLFVFKTDPQDLIAAAAAALLAVVAIQWARLNAPFALPRGWPRAIAPVPVKIVTDTALVLAELPRQILRRRRAIGETTAVRFDYGANGPDDVARLAISLIAISITPNSVVLTTTPEAILVHRLSSRSSDLEGRDQTWPV